MQEARNCARTRAADETVNERLHKAQVDTEDRRLCDAEERGNRRGDVKGTLLCIVRTRRDSDRSTALRNDRTRDDRVERVKPRRCEQLYLKRVEDMVHAEYDDDLMHAADDESANAVRELQEGTHRTEDANLKRVHDGSDDEESQQHRDKQCQERSYDEVDDVGHEGLEPLLQTRGKDAEHECGQNRALIADDGDRNPEDVH